MDNPYVCPGLTTCLGSAASLLCPHLLCYILPLQPHNSLIVVYRINIGRTDREQIRSRINNNDCRTFRPRRPLSTAYKTTFCTQLTKAYVLYAVDKGLRGRNVLQSLLLILLRICSRSVRPILTSSNEPLQHHIGSMFGTGAS